jgi:peptidoglycan/LPS O-acetylase OafA/YrhL
MATALLLWLLVSGLATLVAWSSLRRRGWIGYAVANAVVVFIAYNVAMPRNMDIRVDLLLTVPLVMVILILGIAHLQRMRASSSDHDPSAKRSPARPPDQSRRKT